MIVLQVF